MRRLWMAAAVIAATGWAQPVLAEEYTLFIYETPADLALRSDPGPKGAAYWSGYAATGQALAQAGVLKGGAALDPAPAGVVPASHTAKASRTLGGYFVIDVPDREAALAWAAKIPAAKTGSVEVRLHAPAKTGPMKPEM